MYNKALNGRKNIYINNKGVIIQTNSNYYSKMNNNTPSSSNNNESSYKRDGCKMIFLSLFFLICLMSGLNKFVYPIFSLKTSLFNKPIVNTMQPLQPDYTNCNKIGK